MAQDTTPALVLYVGKPDQTYGFDFDKGSFGDVKVAFVRRGLTDYTYDPDTFEVHGFLYAWNGGVYTKTETPDTSTPLYDKDGVATGDNWEATMYREPKNDILSRGYVEWTGEPLTSNDVICIVRETQKDQPYSYPNNQKHIERALDNLSRQIQELQLTADNALKVDPSWNYTMDDTRKMDPIAWLQTIVRSKGLTLRELRVEDGYVMYTSDDPESDTKTWEVIAGVKTDNAGVISHIREHEVTLQDGSKERYLQYSVDGGATWADCANTSNVSFAEVHGSPYDNTALALVLNTLSGNINGKVSKTGDTMSGPLEIIKQENENVPLLRLGHKDYPTHDWFLIPHYESKTFNIAHKDVVGEQYGVTVGTNLFAPMRDNYSTLGHAFGRWKSVYAKAINNGYDIGVPETSQADTLALKSQVDLAANSGTQLRDKGVWYAKMDAATTPPASAGVEGRNYADFTQVDSDNSPTIVIYTYTSGAWVQTETITPPDSYNGYLPITSKFWDIQEQTGQQGGLVLWAYSSKRFTPYPRIVSTDSLSITNSSFQGYASLSGTSTVVMPANPSNTQIVNKDYVDTRITNISGFELFDFKWRDATSTSTTWLLSDNEWKTNTNGYNHLKADADASATTVWTIGIQNTFYGGRYPAADHVGEAHPYAFRANSSLNWEDYYYVYCDTEEPAVGVDTLYNGYASTATSIGVASTGGQENAFYFLAEDVFTNLPTVTALFNINNLTVYRYPEGDVEGASHPYCWANGGGSIGCFTDSETPAPGDSYYSEATSATASGTIGNQGISHDITLPYYLAADGHKIVPSAYMAIVSSLYAETGVAWYYIIDTTNTQFKLPRTKFGFNGLRGNVGDYVTESLPNIKGSFTAGTFAGNVNGSGAFSGATAPYNWAIRGEYTPAYGGLYPFSASNSSSVYQDGAPVQERGTQMYLYFYVGA